MIILKSIKAGKQTLALKRIFKALVFAGAALVVFFVGWILSQSYLKPEEKPQVCSVEKRFTEYFLSPFFFPVSTEGGNERLIRIRFALLLIPGPGEGIKKNLSALRSVLYKRLRLKSVKELSDPERLSALRREVQDILNQRLDDCMVEKVLVTELLIF